jgi:hypothetical protein
MGSALSGSPEQSIPTGHVGHPLKGCVPLVPLAGQERRDKCLACPGCPSSSAPSTSAPNQPTNSPRG